MVDKSNYISPDHSLSRRNLLSWMGLLPFFRFKSGEFGDEQNNILEASQNWNKLPAKNLFDIKGTYLNAASIHPMSIGSAQAVKKYLDFRLANGKETDTIDSDRDIARGLFARLINADADEISWIPSTMVGENLIVNSLGIPGTPARIVTDAYHFDGSLYMYQELEKQGAKVQVVLPKNNKIDLADLDQAIKPGTKLVAISLISMINGFQHDLKAVCDIAHSRGALVYADIIQAAGSVPVDVHDSKVDFCACATYKWLMGDFGVGLLYVRKDRLPLLKRSQFGYRQIKDMKSHLFPFDQPGTAPFDFVQGDKTRHYFEVGTLGNAAVPALLFSLNYLLTTGIDKVQLYRQPMIDKLQSELPRLGFIPLTTPDSTSAIVSFARENAEATLHQKLSDAGISISLYQHRLRIAPSMYNSLNDIDHLIKVLS